MLKAYKITNLPWTAYDNVTDTEVVIAKNIVEASSYAGKHCIAIELIGQVTKGLTNKELEKC